VQKRKALEEGLNDIEKRIQSKKEVFDAGQHGLQAYRARAIQSTLGTSLNEFTRSFDMVSLHE